MNPKDKAAELVAKYSATYRIIQNSVKVEFDLNGKQCARICVKEILDLPINEWCAINDPYQDFDWWREVLKEIDLL